MSDALIKLANRIFMLFGKALVDTVDDTTKIQLVKISGLADEVQDKIERVQNFGFTSNPPSGSESLIACIGGNRDHTVVIASDSSEFRKKNLKPGECAVYDKNGNYIYLKENGSVEITASGGVMIDGDVEINGNLTVTGDIETTGNVSTALTDLNGLYTDYLAHVHSGVTVGGGVTGPKVP